MSLIDSILTSYSRAASHVVTVAGIPLYNVVSGTVNFSLDLPVPTAELVMNKVPTWIKRDDPITIDWIYDGYTTRIFTGIVKRRRHETGQGRLECVGKTNALYRPFRVQPITFSSVTAAAAVTQILAAVGITDYNIGQMVAWTIGTVQPAILDLKSPGDSIQHIIEVDLHRQYETPTGTFIVRPLLAVPAPTPFRTYKTTAGTNPRITDIGDDEDEDQVKKKVYVSGATLATTDAEGNQTQMQIGGKDHPIYAQTTSNDLVAGDPELYSMQYQNDLIQDTAKAGTVALALLNKYHRVVQTISFTVPLDPQIQLAQTIGIEDNTITGIVSRWFVNGYKHTWSATAADTQLDLIGGDQSGTTGDLVPISDFTWLSEQELIGSGPKMVVAFVSASYALDSTITDLHWTDDYPGTPMNQHGPTMTVVTRVYDPAVASKVNVTLVVTDAKGLTGTYTAQVNVTAAGSQSNAQMTIPNIVGAAYNTVMLTPDGGFTWKDQAIGGSHVISTAALPPATPTAIPILLFGTDNGSVLRSVDALGSAPTLVLSADLASPINDIMVQADIPGRAYAATDAGYLYRSDDYGATWLTVLTACGYPIKVLGQQPGTVYIFGGAATATPTTWSTLARWSYDGGFTWTAAPIAGALGTALAAASGTYYVACCAATTGNEMCWALGGIGSMDPRVFYTPKFQTDGTAWVVGLGLDPALGTPQAMAPNNTGNSSTEISFVLFFNTRDSWVSIDGITWAANRNVLNVGITVNHLALVYPFKDVYIGAATDGLVKSTSACVNVMGYIRPVGGISTWPAGAVGRKVAFAAAMPKTSNLVAAFNTSVGGAPATNHITAIRQGGSNWTKESDEAGRFRWTSLFRFPALAAGILFRCRADSYNITSWSALQKSLDNGQTWSDTTVPMCPWVDCGSDGILWAIGSGGDAQTHCIYKSTDNGATWSIVYTDSNKSMLQYCCFTSIRVSLTDPNHILAFGPDKDTGMPNPVGASSVDGGVTWIRRTPTWPDNVTYTVPCSPALVAGLPLQLGGSRWVISFLNIIHPTYYLITSDDDGATWITRSTYVAATGINSPWLINAGLVLYYLIGGGAAEPGVLYQSLDNGESWQTIALPAGNQYPETIAYDGQFGRIYLGCNQTAAPIQYCDNPQATGNNWINLLDNLNAFYASNWAATGGLAVISSA